MEDPEEGSDWLCGATPWSRTGAALTGSLAEPCAGVGVGHWGDRSTVTSHASGFPGEVYGPRRPGGWPEQERWGE